MYNMISDCRQSPAFAGFQTVDKGGCRISKYFCWAAALLSAQNGIEISYGSDAIL